MPLSTSTITSYFSACEAHPALSSQLEVEKKEHIFIITSIAAIRAEPLNSICLGPRARPCGCPPAEAKLRSEATLGVNNMNKLTLLARRVMEGHFRRCFTSLLLRTMTRGGLLEPPPTPSPPLPTANATNPKQKNSFETLKLIPATSVANATKHNQASTWNSCTLGSLRPPTQRPTIQNTIRLPHRILQL